MSRPNGWQRWQAPSGVVLDFFHWSSSEPGRNVLITAGIHGDEYEGPAAVLDFIAHFDPARLTGTLTLIPVANPPAYQAGTRLSPDGLNIARCFPGKADGHPTEQLAAALFHEFASHADFLIDLHSGGVEYLFVPVAGFYGEAHSANPSFEAARHFGLPLLWQLPITRGVLSCELHARGAVVIGNEYLGAGQLSEHGAAAYCEGILRCLNQWRVYRHDAPAAAEPRVFAGDWQLAKTTGLFRSQVTLGQVVAANQTLAVILDQRGSVLETFTAPHPGLIGGLRNKAFLPEGNWAVLLMTELHAE